jgi:hypothetical protein
MAKMWAKNDGLGGSKRSGRAKNDDLGGQNGQNSVKKCSIWGSKPI